MSGLAEFLKGTISDSLRKLFQPSGVLPGALFVLLNLAFVYPAAHEEKVSVAVSYGELDSGWQAVVLGTLILGIGFLLLSASSLILDILSGRVWRPALSGRVMREVRELQRKRLDARIASRDRRGHEAEEMLVWRRRTRFVRERRRSTSTTLGDALVAAGDATHARYGMRMSALWEPLRASLRSDDVAIAAADEENAVLGLSGNLAFVLGLYTLEAAILLSLLEHWSDVLTALLLLPIAYAAYRITVTKAISWADAVDTVAALHRDALRTAMRLPAPGDQAEARRQFERLSEFMLDASRPMPGDTTPSEVSATPSEGLVVQVVTTREQDPPEGVGAARHSALVRCHLLAARRAASTRPAAVEVRAPAVPSIRSVPDPSAGGDGARGELSVDGERLTWTFDALALDAAEPTQLAFPLVRWEIAVDGGLTLRVEEHDEHRLHLEIEQPATTGGTGVLTIFHAFASPPSKLSVAARDDGGELVERAPGRWQLPPIAHGDPLRVAVRLPGAEGA